MHLRTGEAKLIHRNNCMQLLGHRKDVRTIVDCSLTDLKSTNIMDNEQTPPPPEPRRNMEPRKDQSYFERLVGYIPADILAAYMTFSGILADEPSNPVWLHWAGFIALLILAPFYCIYRPTDPPPMLYANKTYYCAAASTLSFAAWCFALGGPFAATFDWYRPVYGSLVLILTALILPILEKILLKQDPPSSNS